MQFNYLLKTSLVLLLAISVYNTSSAQTVVKSEAESTKKDSVVIKRAQTFFVELAGPGITISANYDTRFSKAPDGWGARIGIGYIADNSYSLTTIPLQVNYLLGKKNKFFEIGVGATYLSLNDKQPNGDTDILTFDDDTTFVGALTFGYRYQPIDGGFSFRGSFNPLFNSNSFVPYFGISLGYAF